MLIESIQERHPWILAGFFVPHALSALLRHDPLPRRDYELTLRNIPLGDRIETIELESHDEESLGSVEALNRTLQEEVITEYGAIGLALLYVAEYTGQQVVEVTQRRERADYWIGREPGDKDTLLEVSGLDHASQSDIKAREEQKVEQVRKNRDYKKPFFVAICEFCNGFSIFSKNEAN